MTDAETTAAIESLAHRIRTRDEAMRNGGEYADADPFALEFITALRAKGGWRPTPAKAYPAPKPAIPGPAPEVRPETSGLLAEARARCEQATEAQHAAMKTREAEAGAA